MRRAIHLLIFFLMVSCPAVSADVQSYAGRLIDNPPPTPKGCRLIEAFITLEGDSPNLYSLFECNGVSRSSEKYFRLWRLRGEETKSTEAINNPIRVVDEVIVPWRKVPKQFGPTVYSCSIKGEKGSFAGAILPDNKEQNDDLMIKNALAAWRITSANERIEIIATNLIESCKVFRG